MDIAVEMGFAHAAGNQLGDLGAEVEDEDLVVLHGLENGKARPACLRSGSGHGMAINRF
ncbi:hypothetical protein D3C80_2171520 [compost metagenome]